MGRDGAGCPLPDGPGCPLGLDREHAGLNWAAALVLLVSEMSSLTPGTRLLPQRRSVIEFVLSC